VSRGAREPVAGTCSRTISPSTLNLVVAAWIPSELQRILDETPALQRAYLVGGCVRDWLLGTENKDFDIEVFGIACDELAASLARWGRIDLVGRSFGVVKLTVASGRVFDFSTPRRDSKVAPGHKGFDVALDPSISPRDASIPVFRALLNPRLLVRISCTSYRPAISGTEWKRP